MEMDRQPLYDWWIRPVLLKNALEEIDSAPRPPENRRFGRGALLKAFAALCFVRIESVRGVAKAAGRKLDRQAVTRIQKGETG